METMVPLQSRRIRRFLISLPLLAASAVLVQPGGAHAGYPDKPIKLLIGFPPGGSTDLIGRLVGERLYKALGQPVVIENHGGANGMVAANAVAAAAPDGYTLLLTSMGMTTNPYLYTKSRDPLKDFTSISLLANVSNVIVVNPKLPARDLAELMRLARSRKTPLTSATTGQAAPGHLATELLQRAANVKFSFVPYKGSGPALNDVMGGYVDMSLPTVVAALPAIRAGKVRAIAVTGTGRSSLLPEVPTLSEAGLKDLSGSSGWYGLVGPAQMPSEVVERLSQALVKIMSNSEVRARFQSNGADPVGSNSDEMAAFVAQDYRRWGELIKAANIKAEGQ
ncbi:Bug family tripartite tricarboxylate transporter substrate binding protein [Cupriavidus basilensis]|uniref:Bug family tripartite tricarboxylate transporter substrate binding protein n=1 Tax=Cupriavidus basilensis TaxID=68895 RepID=UPI0023E80F46|nr:tripartite tricarboxylate transporter substrate binding protein [Cupriavidus basilensis]MDF3887629.1 tripartite tricarboxylate transporter substrate binding protein [Cupriavidus basilensis]